MSPTTMFIALLSSVHGCTGTGVVREGCTRGSGDRGGAGRGYTGTPPRTLPGPYLVISEAKGPTHGQMKANMVNSMRYPEN